VTQAQPPRPEHEEARKPARSSPRKSASAAPKEGRLTLIGVKVDAALRREIDLYAEAHGVSRSRAAGHYLAIARETLREREGIPAGRADELIEALDGLRAAVDILGPPTLGMLRLLAHWASQGSPSVKEDELLAEVRSVGADEWEQAVAEAERDLQEAAEAGVEKGRR
jgi:hypothetical protein